MLKVKDIGPVVDARIDSTARIDIERGTTVEGHESIGLPAADHLIQKPWDVGSKALAVAEGKVVDDRRNEGMALVLVRVAVVQPERRT